MLRILLLLAFASGCLGGKSADYCASTYVDADEDGGITTTEPDSCVVLFSDCDDDDPTVHVFATEECDGVDNNCNEEVDEDDVCPTA
jgi:Putative metal-binding motif